MEIYGVICPRWESPLTACSFYLDASPAERAWGGHGRGSHTVYAGSRLIRGHVSPPALSVWSRIPAIVCIALAIVWLFTDGSVLRAGERGHETAPGALTRSPPDLNPERLLAELEVEVREALRHAMEQRARTSAGLKSAIPEGVNAVSALINALDETEREWACRALGVRSQSDPEPAFRSTCLASLLRWPEAARQPLLRAVSHDQDRGVRRLAAYALATQRGDAVVDALLEAAKADKGAPREGHTVAAAAIGALGDIGGQRAARVLQELWQDATLSKEFGDGILSALGRAGDLAALETIEQQLADKTATHRVGALMALGELARKNPANGGALRSIAKLARNHVADGNWRTREGAARVLGLAGSTDDIVNLDRLLMDPHSTGVTYREGGVLREKTTYPVREAAREAIERIRSRGPMAK